MCFELLLLFSLRLTCNPQAFYIAMGTEREMERLSIDSSNLHHHLLFETHTQFSIIEIWIKEFDDNHWGS